MKRTLTKSPQFDRRLFERRRFRYSDYMPERRSGRERRTAARIAHGAYLMEETREAGDTRENNNTTSF